MIGATEGGNLDLVLFTILLGVCALVVLAYVSRVPYPILLTLGGMGIGFVPGLPTVELQPDVVLLIFLPPLLYSAAFFSSLRDLRANLRPISLLALGLVVATVFAVGFVAQLVVPGIGWAEALVLGAVLSPTDPVAATAIAGRLGAPRRITTIVEGESLVNDSSALIAFRFALAAATTGAFSVLEAGGEFLTGVAGGIAVGLLAGWLVAQVRRRIEHPPTEIAISIVTAYLAYLPADHLGLSGVVAAVTAGIYLGWRASELAGPTTRLQSYAVWEILVFLANAALFVLIGLELPAVLEGVRETSSPTQLLLYVLAMSLAVVLTRLLWLYPLTYLPRVVVPGIRRREGTPKASWIFVLGWSGLRGAVSLAAALSIPNDFPQRGLIIFLVFGVVVFTVVGQGLTLPLVIKGLGVHDDGAEDAEEETRARLAAADTAIARVDELVAEDWVREDTAERVRGLYGFRRRRVLAYRGELDGDGGELERRSLDYQRLVREILRAQERALLALRNERVISDEVMRRVQRELDLEDNRLDLDRDNDRRRVLLGRDDP